MLCGLLLFTLVAGPDTSWAWPADSQWIPLPRDSAPITDDEGDTQGARNIVPDDGAFPAAYIYNDGSYLYYRMRLDEDPTGSGGQGILQSFGWGFEIDIDQNAYDYEWLIMCDGIEAPETVSLQLNTDKTHVGDPSDKAEYIAAEYPLVGNHRIIMADTCTNDATPGDGCGTSKQDSRDYFLDFRLPYAVFKAVTGITDNTLVRYFVGSSSSSWTLVEQGADLVVGTNAISGHELLSEFSDFVTPFGTIPSNLTFHNAEVNFVDSLDGFNDVTAAAPADRLFIKVYDPDLTLSSNPSGMVLVTITTPGGDIETVTLNATGVSGKYTGYIDTVGVTSVNVAGDIYATNDDTLDGTLQVIEGETIEVEYLDIIAANRVQNVSRTDILLITSTGLDIVVTKTVDNNIPAENDAIIYVLEVTNNGPADATGLVISDPQPSGVSFTTFTGTWNIGSLASGASVQLNIDATVNAGTNGSSIDNIASVSALDQTDVNTTNDEATATINIGGTDLQVTKVVDTPYPNETDVLQYTIQVINRGPTPTTGVEVTDLFDPLELTFSTATTSQGSYTTPSSDRVIWSVGSLDVGQAETMTIDVTVNTGTLGTTLSNTANLTATSQPDSNSANNSATATVQVGFLDLELTKTVDNPIPGENDPIVYTLALTNHGPNTATGILIDEALPIGVTYQSHTAGSTDTSYAADVWDVGTITSGTTVTLTINATVDNNTAGQTIVNTAEISPAYDYDYDPSNDFADAPINVDGTDIQVVKTVDNLTPNINDTVVWTITVTNNGPNPATNIELTDILPNGISHVSDVPSAGNYDGSGNNSTGVWDGFDLPNVNDSETLTITTTVDNNQAGNNINNVAFLTMDNLADPNEGNNVDDATISVGGTDLSIVKSVDISNPDVNNTIVYTLVVTNDGPNTANNVQVTDQLPPEVNYVSDDSDGVTNGTYTSATGLWDIGQINVGASVTLQITAVVLDEDQHLVVTNTATITRMDEADPDSSNNTDTADIVVSAADLDIDKIISNLAGPPFEAYEGQPVIYTITVTNTDTNNEVTSVEIEDILPAGVTYFSSLPTLGVYSVGANLWLVGTLPAGGSASLDLTVTVDAPTAGIPIGSTITNTASLYALDQIDTDTSNDSASVDFTTIDPPALPLLTFLKMSSVAWDPINGPFPNARPIPGANVEYTLRVTNSGTGAAENIVFTDPIPANTRLLVTGTPVIFTEGATPSGFVQGDVSVAYSSNADCADYNYDPVPSAVDGFNTDVCNLRITMNNTKTLPGGNAAFDLTFTVRIE